MPIKTIYSKKEKTGWTYDYKKKQWRGFLLDTYQFDGENKPLKRIRIQYARKSDAEAAELSLDVEKQNAKFGIISAKYKKIITARELFDKRLASTNQNDYARAVRVFNSFIDLLPESCSVLDVKQAHFTEYNNLRLSKGVKAETVRREINILGPAFRRASELFPELEDYQPPRIPRPKVKPDHKKKRIISESEMKAIVGYLTGPQKGTDSAKVFENKKRIGRLFEIGWLLGLRFSEIARLKKTDFNLKEKTLRVVRWKTNNLTLFDFLPEFICDLIQAAINESRTEFIFTHTGSRPKHFYPILKEAVEAAGLDYGRDSENGIVFHSTRHAFITRMVQITDLATAQNFSGHSTKEMLGHYAHSTNESRKNAMKKMYGENNKFSESALRSIFEAIQEKRMTFDQFKEMFLG